MEAASEEELAQLAEKMMQDYPEPHVLRYPLEAITEEELAQLAEKMMQDYPEPHVLRYILEAITEEEEDADETPMRDDYKGLAFVYLKTVLDAFIAASRPGR